MGNEAEIELRVDIAVPPGAVFEFFRDPERFSQWMGAESEFEVPIAFFLGRHDYTTPSELAAAYLQRLTAPSKRLVWFEASSHFPFLSEPERFHEALREFDARQ